MTHPKPIYVFILILGASWLFWIPAALLPLAEPAWPVLVLHYAGGVMPTVVTLVLLYTCAPRPYRRDFWQRVIDLTRIPGAWYAVILLTIPALTASAILLDRLLGDSGVELAAAQRFISQPLALLPYMGFMLLFGPLPEELAWRGYGLDRLQARHNALRASLILGLIWTVWHLPLFWIEGSYQYGLGVGTPAFWLYMSDKIPQSILMTWIFNHTRRSTASAVLFHFVVNFTGELFDITPRAEVFYIALQIAAAGAIVAWQGPSLNASQEVTNKQ